MKNFTFQNIVKLTIEITFPKMKNSVGSVAFVILTQKNTILYNNL